MKRKMLALWCIIWLIFRETFTLIGFAQNYAAYKEIIVAKTLVETITILGIIYLICFIIGSKAKKEANKDETKRYS